MIHIYIIISFLLLIAAELFYIPVARRNNWTSARNNRSDKHPVAVVGAGFVFYVAILLYSFGIGWLYQAPYAMSNMFIGLTMLAACSFFDDLLQLKVWIRLVVQFISVMFLVFQFNLFSMPLWVVACFMIFAVGIINGYNFMDGINGITAAYSVSVLGIFLYINTYTLHFISGLMILFALMSVVVFGFFNFRNRAIAFSGDVGSICMGYIIVVILTSYILTVKDFSAIIFIIVYLTDIVMTILRRIIEKENIFRPHHKHIYQLLNRNWGINQLKLASCYSFLQIVISVLYLHISEDMKWCYFIVTSMLLVVAYIAIAYITHKKKTNAPQQKVNIKG